MRVIRHLLVTLAVVLAAGCAPTTEFLRASSEAPAVAPAHRVYIAGVTADDDQRRRYEDVFVAELARAGIEGVGSHALIPSTRGLTMDEMRARMHAAATGADAVLHVQLAGLVPSTVMSPQDVPADGAPAHGNVNGIAVTLNAPRDGQVRGATWDVELVSNYYALPSRKLLWTGVTRTRESSRLEDIARSHARAVIRALADAGYIAGGKR